MNSKVSKMSELSEYYFESDAQSQHDELGAALMHSRSIEYSLRSNYGAMNECVEHLYHKVLKEHLVGQRERGARAKKATINIVICNLYSIWLADMRYWLSIDMNNNNFNALPDRYRNRNITQRTFPQVVKALKVSGLIELHTGFINRNTGKGRLTRIQATEKLIQILRGDYGVRIYMIHEEPCAETIILKNSNKRLIDYVDNEYTNRSRDNLAQINEAIWNSNFNLRNSDQQEERLRQRIFKYGDEGREPVEYSQILLKRKYNNSRFDHGGRFYGHWAQILFKDQRPRIVHNGQPTVEIDYSAMHPMMLYAEANLTLPKDPYILDGFEIPNARDKCKKIFNTMVNAKTQEAALKSIRKYVLRNVDLPTCYPTARSVMEAMLVKHSAISGYLNNNAGVKLQFRDAQIAEEIMLKLLRYNIVAIPIHDSFIVNHSYRDTLMETMVQVFEEHVDVPAKTKWDDPLFKVKSNTERCQDDILSPEGQVLLAQRVEEEQRLGTSPYSNYEVRNAYFHERVRTNGAGYSY